MAQEPETQDTTFVHTLFDWQNEGTAPSENLKTNGFQGGYKPPASVFNYFWSKVTKAITELQNKVLGVQTGKVDKVTGKGLSTNDYTTAEKTKLAGISESADSVSFTQTKTSGEEIGKININGANTPLYGSPDTHYSSSTIVADSKSATSNSSAVNGLVHINHIENNEVKSSHVIVGTGATQVTASTAGDILLYSTDTTYSEATTSNAGLMSASDKSKVDNMATNIKNGSSPGSLQGVLGATASSSGAFATGLTSEANGVASFAIGESTAANGAYSFASGRYSLVQAGSSASSANGLYTSASGYGQFCVGKYNTLYAGPESTDDTEGTQFIVGVGTSATRSNAFRVTTDGYCRGQRTFTGSGADYAEYFEWIDGNANNEDRRGYFVTLEGNKIRKATAEDDYILGVISANPAIIGNTYSDMWQGVYLTDVFGERLTETVEVPETVDPDTEETIPAHSETRFIVNPEYDPEQPYAGRHERTEWDSVGIVGQLIVVDDGTCEVNGYCKVADGGTATKSNEKTEYRVIKRIDNTHVIIFIK